VKVGVVFPQTEIGPDPADVRAYVQAVERAGFDHIAIYDHVLGAVRREGLNGPYDLNHQFHEVMVLFGFIAAVTTRIELATEVLVLPQRQAALAAKQAAEIDLLSGGRLRLGVGIGWNFVEYEALGMSFRNRGRRMEEQIALMRRLWSEPEVTHRGEHHVVDRAGLNPFPPRRIPIWIGATADAAIRRAARIADGWQSELGLGPELEANLGRLRSYLAEYGRDVAAFGIAGEVGPGAKGVADALRWAELGATHVSVTTMDGGLATAADHIVAALDFKRRWDEQTAEAAR
jgi:probable F420-dependent oxidoreductase